MSRHTRPAFMILTVIILISLAVVAELLATRYLVNLRLHVRQRQQLIQKRIATPPAPFPHMSFEKIPSIH